MQKININTIEYSIDEATAIIDGFNNTLPPFTIAHDKYLLFVDELLLKFPDIISYTYNLFNSVNVKLKNENFRIFVNGTTDFVYITILTKSEHTNNVIWNVLLASLENTESLTVH